MGLKADIEEVTQFWGRSPWRVKVFLSLSFFLSTSSIASLSEAVFKWKGFFLDALAFYRLYVSGPVGLQVQHLLSYPLPPTFIDHSIILALFFSSMIRVMLYRQKTMSGKVNYTLIFLICYFGILHSLAHERHIAPTALQMSPAWTFFPAVLLWLVFSLKGAERLLAIAYLLGPPFAVGLLGAISAGLNR